jgi:hypothetical protein
MTGWPRERVALVFEDEEYTYGRLESLAGGYAVVLAARGVQPGDRVALMGSNRPEWVAAVLGAWRLGAAVALFSPSWKQAETEHAVRIVQPAYGIGDHPVLPALLPVLGYPGRARRGGRRAARAPGGDRRGRLRRAGRGERRVDHRLRRA